MPTTAKVIYSWSRKALVFQKFKVLLTIRGRLRWGTFESSMLFNSCFIWFERQWCDFVYEMHVWWTNFNPDLYNEIVKHVQERFLKCPSGPFFRGLEKFSQFD